MSTTTALAELEDIATVRQLAANGEAERIRLRAGLDAQPVADTIGVARVSLRRWERGERRPTGEAALRYLKVLKALDKIAAAQ